MAAPDHVVVGVADLDQTVAFLALFDMVEKAAGTMDAEGSLAAFGVERTTPWRAIGAPGSTRGNFLLAESQSGTTGRRRQAIEVGPLAIDVYTRDMDVSLARVDAAGWDRGHLGTIELGPLVMRQCEIWAPDGWRLVLVEANRRRPSLLDTDESALHSEIHSLLWTVPSIEAARRPFEAAGLVQSHVFPIKHPELAKIVGLPAPDTTMVMNLMVAEEEPPVRLELCEFPEHPGQPSLPTALEPGIWAVGLVVDELPSEIGDLEGETIIEGNRMVRATTDHGVRVAWHVAS